MSPVFASMWLFLACVLLHLYKTSAIEYTPEIEIQSGKLRGFLETLPKTKAKIRKYLGIPFAGAERFEKPDPPLNWTDVKNMTSFGKICFQGIRRGTFEFKVDDMSEDCLNLNIYVPDKQTSVNSKLPVMVWIHGGGYGGGSNRIADGSYLATIGGVIVVTINYRLGILGFLSAKHYGFTGNYGLYDQLEALKWVKCNIEKFGGDSNQVTIFGNSAGGMSVSLLSLSPLARGLFKYAIMQSGVANSPLAYNLYQGKIKERNFFNKKFNCRGTVAEVKNCTNSLPIPILAGYHLHYTRPVVDGAIIPDQPENIFNKSLHINLQSVLIGVADDDGSCMTDAIPDLSVAFQVFGAKINNKKKILAIVTQAKIVSKNPLYVQAATCKYTNNKTDFTNVDSNRRIILDILTHSLFTAPGVVHANDYVRRGVDTFFYQVEYGLPMPRYFKVPPLLNGYHETEKFMVFGFPLKHKELECSFGTPLSYEMIKMWSNFAKTGNPNTPTGLQHGVQWPKYDLKKQQYLAIKPTLEIKSHLQPGFVKFWEKDLRSLDNTTLLQMCKAKGAPMEPMVKLPNNTNVNASQWRF